MTVKMMTAALATSAFVMGAGLAAAQSPQTPPQPSPRPQTEQPRTAGTQTGQQDTMNEIVLQGCLARDDASSAAGRSGAATGATAGGAATAAASGGTTFLLKNAKRQDAQSGTSAKGTASQSSTAAQQSARTGSSPSGMGDENTYRLMASGASVNLSEHVGHQIEVRGRMMESSMSTRGTASGETKQAGQAGQTGQTAQADQRAGGAYAAGSDQYKSVMVSSVRMISQTCSTAK